MYFHGMERALTFLQFLPGSKPVAAHAATTPALNLPSATALGHEQFWTTLAADWRGDLLAFLHISLPKLVVVAVITLVLIQLLQFATRRLRRLANPEMVGHGRAGQIRTLATVIRTAGWAIIIFHAAIQSLEIFNINVTPLLASAGVAGVAVGFGAQTIVHDVINGMLILIENQFNVGDMVKIANVTGTVEDMSLRRTTIRDSSDGSLYTVPNSQITTVSNLTRDWSQIQVNISVDYREDAQRVIKILSELADQLAADPRFQPMMSGAPSVLGIDAFQGSQVIYAVVFKTSVNNQWKVAREYRLLVKDRFSSEQILAGDPQRIFNYSPSGISNQPTAAIAATTITPTDTTPKA